MVIVSGKKFSNDKKRKNKTELNKIVKKKKVSCCAYFKIFLHDIILW